MTLELVGQRATLLPALSGATEVTGVLDARGLLTRAPVQGRVRHSAGSLATRYELSVQDAEGRTLQLTGARNPKLSDPVYSSSTVQAELRDHDNRALATFVLRLDYRQSIARFLPCGR